MHVLRLVTVGLHPVDSGKVSMRLFGDLCSRVRRGIGGLYFVVAAHFGKRDRGQAAQTPATNEPFERFLREFKARSADATEEKMQKKRAS